MNLEVNNTEDVKRAEKYVSASLDETPLCDYVDEVQKHMQEVRRLTYFSHLVIRIKEAQRMAEELKELVDKINLDPSVLERL